MFQFESIVYSHKDNKHSRHVEKFTQLRLCLHCYTSTEHKSPVEVFYNLFLVVFSGSNAPK